MRRLALLMCAMLLAGAAHGGWQPNLVDFPSAEDDRNRDDGPDGWESSPFRSPAKLAWDDAVAHSGRHSLRISDSAAEGTDWNQYTGRWVTAGRKAVAPGRAYTLGAWIKTDGVTGYASARIAWWHDGHWLAESRTDQVRGTTDWRHMTVTAKAPAKATEAQVYLGLSNSKGRAWFDDVALVHGNHLPGRLLPVDISVACNAGLKEAVGTDADDLPTGTVHLRGIPFRILAPEWGGGKSCVALKRKTPRGAPEAAIVPVGRTCETLYFLHASAGAKDGARVGAYEILYDDGSQTDVPLVAGREVTDRHRPSDTKAAAVGWEGGEAGLAVFPVANPKPQTRVKAVRLAGAADAGLVLAAVTTADGPAVLTDRPIRYEFTDTSGWYPFTFPLNDVNLETIDLTGFLDGPAGKHGFVTVGEDGHFHFADGTRARFFGTNVGGQRAFPAKKDAEVLAARLAKYGVNLLRIHAIDGQWGQFIDFSKGDSRHFKPEAFDRLDYFFAELKKRGIYVYFDMLDYRRFMPGDGVADAAQFEHGWHHSIKGATIFNDRLIELQKEFATRFFTHGNPYTGLTYTNDPAVAVVEITNENSVFYFRNTTLTLPVYADELRKRWNQWLLDRYGDRPGLAAAWTHATGACALLPAEDPARGTVILPMKHLHQDPKGQPFVGERSPVRVDAMGRFFFDLQRRYYGAMRSHLAAIGIKVPITGTNQTFCPASVYADSVNDFMSRNNYWKHPNVHAKPFFTFRNQAVTRSDLGSTANPMTNIASSTVAGKPMISPEFNWPWPIEYRAECLPMMAAYACLQDWDGLLFFAYNPGRPELECFGSQSDPVRWGQFPAAAMLFHRGDVRTARKTVHVGWSEKEAFTGRPSHIYAKTSPFRAWTYVSKVRNAFYRDAYQGNATLVRGVDEPPVPTSSRYASDTGELVLDAVRERFTIDTPRTKAAVGSLGQAGDIDLGGVTVRCRTPFAAVMVTSMDGKPVEQARRLLVTAVARAENTGQAFCRNKTSVPQRGRAPVLVEPVDADVAIRTAGAATVYPLDETGKRRRPLAATFAGGALRLALEDARSPWCEIVVESGGRAAAPEHGP